MKSWLYPGAKVVCHSLGMGDEGWEASVEATPIIGGIYTVSNVYVSCHSELMVELAEIPAPGTRNWLAGFVADNFRPLTKRSTDTQVQKLKSLLNTTPADLEKVDG